MNKGAVAVTLSRSALPMLLLLAMEIADEETGLSKGPANPADIGSRCAVIAGRDDRAYLHCAEQARRRATAADESGIPSDRPHVHPGWSDDGVTRRYPLRGR
jgi:hypothetical protein